MTSYPAFMQLSVNVNAVPPAVAELGLRGEAAVAVSARLAQHSHLQEGRHSLTFRSSSGIGRAFQLVPHPDVGYLNSNTTL